VKPISKYGTERIARAALRWAVSRSSVGDLRAQGQHHEVHEGSFAKWGYELAAREFGDVTVTEKALWDELDGRMPAGKILVKDRIADSIFQQIQTRPDEYSVLCLPNLNGDYLSDAAIALVGGSPRTGGQHERRGGALRGDPRTAPKYTGMDKVNPVRSSSRRS